MQCVQVNTEAITGLPQYRILRFMQRVLLLLSARIIILILPIQEQAFILALMERLFLHVAVDALEQKLLLKKSEDLY